MLLNKQLLIPLSNLISRKMVNLYKEAIETLNKLQSNVEYIKQAKIKNQQENNMSEMEKFLNRTEISLEKLDNVPVIHVAGTNGKGTTCFYCENILRQHGYKTGFYSSPHLLEVRERIRLNGSPISRDMFAEYFWKVYDNLDKKKINPLDMPLYFRILTIMALNIFLEEKVDVAILEVGIGGEYDCTNIVRNTIAAGITPLDIDHTSLLGNSIESIAWHKAGIMKPGAQVFTSIQPESAMEILRQRSIERHCTLKVIDDFYIDDKNFKIPRHVQTKNASLALALCEAFILGNLNKNKPDKTFRLDVAKKAIESSQWIGRYEIIPKGNSIFYLDGAHTVSSMEVCAEWFLSQAAINDGRERILIFNITGERNPDTLLKVLLKCEFNTVIFVPNVGTDEDNADVVDYNQRVQHQIERCLNYKLIWQDLNANGGNVEVFSSYSKAVSYLENQRNKKFNVLTTGSIHLIGAALSVLNPTLNGIL